MLERINAASGLRGVQAPRATEVLLALLKDKEPRVRNNAVQAVGENWDPRFIDPLVALLRDPYPEIREQAAQRLSQHESTNHVPTYLALLRDPDPDVQASVLGVLSQINGAPIPRADVVPLLGSSRLETVAAAMSLLQGRQPLDWTYLPRIADFRSQGATVTNRLSSAEAAPLVTNRLTMARLVGLKVLRQNADSEAVALTLPLLRDTNAIVRNRAFALLQTVSGQDISRDDPAKWEQWWAANKGSYSAPK